MVESQPSKLLVAGSIPVSRSSLRLRELSPKRELRLGEPGEGCPAEARSAKAGTKGERRLVGRSGYGER